MTANKQFFKYGLKNAGKSLNLTKPYLMLPVLSLSQLMNKKNVLKFRKLVACQKRPRQTTQTQIRLLPKKQSGQGLPCFAILTNIL